MSKKNLHINSRKHIEKQKETARNTNELVDYLINLVESHTERFSFEWAIGGEYATMEIYDKENEIAYKIKIEPITPVLIDGVTSCCGYDFGVDMDKVHFCPICGKKLD